MASEIKRQQSQAVIAHCGTSHIIPVVEIVWAVTLPIKRST
jgi:hypothetical protein